MIGKQMEVEIKPSKNLFWEYDTCKSYCAFELNPTIK